MNNNDFDELFETAHEHFKNGQYGQAETILNQLILKNKKTPLLFHLLGTIYYDGGKFNKAIRAFKRALEIDPSFTDASVGLSIILNDLGKYDEGQKVFNEAKSMLKSKDRTKDQYVNEKFSKKHEELGDLYLHHLRHKEALEQFLKSVLLVKTRPEPRLKIIECLQGMGENNKAMEKLKELIKDHPKFSQARIFLGETFLKERKYNQAVVQWKQVLEFEPDNQLAKNLIQHFKQSKQEEHNEVHP